MTDEKEKPLQLPYHSIAVDSITIGDRFRKEPGDIQALADNIKEHGLLHPLVIDDNHNLIAGGRRYQAIKLLGWERVDCHYMRDLNEIARRRIELSENLLRKNLTSWEQADLTDEIKRLGILEAGLTEEQLQLIDPQNPHAQTQFSTRAIAEIRGVSAMTVVRDQRMKRGEELMPSLRQEESQANVLKKIDRMVEDLERALEFRKREREVQELSQFVLEGDSTSLICTIATSSIDCIITDPPYGVGNDSENLSHRTAKEFDDSPEAAMALLRSIGPELRRVLKPDGHLWAFYGVGLWEPTLAIWRLSGFDISDVIAIWHKSGGATGTVNWDYDLAPDWEPILLAHNRTRRLSTKHGAVFTYPPDLGSSRVHPNQKPLALIKELITLSTRPGDVILDPFAGSGTVAVAAKELGRQYIVMELDTRYVQIIKERLINAKAPISVGTTQPGISVPVAEPSTVPDDSVVPNADPSMRTTWEGTE